MNTIQFLHIMHSAWKGIYLNGIKISDGYFNIQEIEKAERFLGEFGGMLGFDVRRVEKSQDWFGDLGGRLPMKINISLGESISIQEKGMINYYFGEDYDTV